MSAGIVANLTSIELDGTPIANVKSFSIPNIEYKEFDVTTVDSTIETFKRSTLKSAKEFTFTLLVDTIDNPVSADNEGSWKVSLPIQETGSTTPASFSFDGFVRVLGNIDGDEGGETGLTQEITVRATSEVVAVVES